MTSLDLTSPNLKMPYIAAAQAQKHVTHNEAIRALDALVQLAVSRRDLPAPPPALLEGERFIIASGASGLWVGRAGEVAAWQDGGWTFYTPQEGWTAWISAEGVMVVWDGNSWVAAGSGGGEANLNPAPLVGVNTIADDDNRLAVKSNSTLLSYDDVTPGSGDHRLVLNKAGTSETSSLLFQSGFSGRAEIGLSGADRLSIKVSGDGVSWRDALLIESDGRIAMPYAATSRRLRLRGLASQTFASGVLTPINFDTVDYDTGAFFSASQPDRVTIPAGVTLVTAYAGIAMSLNVTNSIYCELRFTIRGPDGAIKTATACAQQNMAPVKCSGPIPVVEGDKLEVSFYQGSGAENHSQDGGLTFLALESLA